MKKIIVLLLIIFGIYHYQKGNVDLNFLNSFNNGSVVASSGKTVNAQELELQKTLQRIKNNGPFPYSRDGITFQNREGLLPRKSQGYYREYTVDTPGLSHRGPRRVVTGGNPPVVYYYTEDHYRSFRLIQGN